MRKSRQHHGMSKHPLYRKWQDMLQRCHNPKCQTFAWYGGVGVTVCDEWREDPTSFIRWCLSEGWETGMDIDKDTKVSGNKIYSPDTCKIVSHRTNMLAVVSRESGRRTQKLKLSPSDVQEIIRRKTLGDASSQLAKEFKVNHRTINRIYQQT